MNRETASTEWLSLQYSNEEYIRKYIELQEFIMKEINRKTGVN